MPKKKKVVNLYRDTGIYSVKQVLSIGSEEDLHQFWASFSITGSRYDELLEGFVKELYTIAGIILEKKRDIFFDVIIEESDQFYYVTLRNPFAAKWFKSMMKLSKITTRSTPKRTTARLDKAVLHQQAEKKASLREARQAHLIALVETTLTSPLPAYDFLEDEDRDELLRMSEDMVDLLYRAGKHGFNEKRFIQLRSLGNLFAMTLHYYDELSEVAAVMTEFTGVMYHCQQRAGPFREQEITLLDGYVGNIERWVHTLFVQGGADLHFMDNSLKADIEMIRRVFLPAEVSEAEEEDLSGVFDF